MWIVKVIIGKKKIQEYNPSKKYVIVISQDSLRLKVKEDKKKTAEVAVDEAAVDEAAADEGGGGGGDEKKKLDTALINFIRDRLKENNKIIFFDEVHQGSNTGSLQLDMIKWVYTNSDDKNLLLIMTTATYAKPLIKYGKEINDYNGIGNKETVLIEWDYQMIQKMKHFNINYVTYHDNKKEREDEEDDDEEDEEDEEEEEEEEKEEEEEEKEEKNKSESIYLIDKDDPFFKEKMAKLKEITDELNKNGKSCEDISYEYHDSPELIYLLPTLKDNVNQLINADDTGTKINIKQDLKQIFELQTVDKKQKKLKYEGGVNEFLTYIYDAVYENLLHKQYGFVANGMGNFHSQLWFMPTTMKKSVKNTMIPGNTTFEAEDTKYIAPLMREFGKQIINHKKFRKFNVCVMHGGKADGSSVIVSDSSGGTLFFECIQSSDNPKECIKRMEIKSKKEGKSLIILTGQMLRLGISLNCTDVAIHMDSIHSYDIIFQSMFRVLTPRANKKQGFFIDMVFDRAIQFFYEYTINQKKIKKEDFTFEKHRKNIMKNMLDYNVGNIKSSLLYKSTDKTMNSYSDITRAFKLDSSERFEEVKTNITKTSKHIYEEDEKKEKKKAILEPEPEPEPENIEKIKKKVVALLETLKDNPDFKKLLKGIKNEYGKSTKKEKEKKEKYKNTLLHDSALAKTQQGNEVGEPEDEEDEEDEDEDEDEEEDPIDFNTIALDIKNIFTLILLLTSSNDISIESIFAGEYNFTTNDIKKIKECNDDDILYYCYLVINSPKGNNIRDKVVIKKSVREAEEKKREKAEAKRIKDEEKKREKAAAEEKKREKAEAKRKKDEEKRIKAAAKKTSEKKTKISRKKGIEGGADNENYEEDDEQEHDEQEEDEYKEEDIGEIINIHKEPTINEKGKTITKTIYTIKWKDREENYTESEFKSNIDNISFSNNYNLDNIDNEIIQTIIQRKTKLIQFLIINQPNNEINNLFTIIKDEMGRLKSQLDNEKKDFINNPSPDTNFCPALFNDKKNEKVLEIIRERLTPKKEEKKLFGEVFTPLELVCEMLSKIPSNVWKNPNLKWLDPANGIGNFPVVLYFKLMETLKNVDGFSNEQKRSKHIIENMLYMNELNPVNVAVCKKIFKMIDPDATPNIIKGDFLTMDVKNEIKLPVDFKGFDVILGNPPFNPPKTETGPSGNSIWQNFVMKSVGLLNDRGYLCLVHPSGWKKPTEELFKPEKFKNGMYNKQIRQGQVWQILKENGVFIFIYTNDQKNKKMKEYLQFFPAVDYYVYQKSGDKKTLCDTKNVFLGEVISSVGVKLDYNLSYLPNLITIQTQEILHKVTSKEGVKPKFIRYRNGKGFYVDSTKGKYKYIYTYNKKSEPNYQYSNNIGDNNINMNKVIMNFGGGIDYFTIQYVKKEELIGSYDKTMYSKVDSDKEGKRIESFFNSDIVKFIFLITQYASGAITQNEPLVANSITIPSEGTEDYYKFFGIEEHKKYIEDILIHYYKLRGINKIKPTTQENSKINKSSTKTSSLNSGSLSTPTPPPPPSIASKKIIVKKTGKKLTIKPTAGGNTTLKHKGTKLQHKKSQRTRRRKITRRNHKKK